jgi:hypothetical protein
LTVEHIAQCALARPTAPLAKPLKKARTTWLPHVDAEIMDDPEITEDGMVPHPVFKALLSSPEPNWGGLKW